MQLGLRGWAAVFAGGCAGALARTALGEVDPSSAGEWPWATFAVNLAGAFLLGHLVAARNGRDAHPLLGAGFCGALTTFSTMQLELLLMLDEGRQALAASYAAVSVAGGLVAVAAASALTERRRRSA